MLHDRATQLPFFFFLARCRNHNMLPGRVKEVDLRLFRVFRGEKVDVGVSGMLRKPLTPTSTFYRGDFQRAGFTP